MTSGGASVSTLPWPTLNERPAPRQWYMTCSASRRAGAPSFASSMPSSRPMPRTSATRRCAPSDARSRFQRVRCRAFAIARAAARFRSPRASRAPRRSRPSSSRACNGRARDRRRRRGRAARSAPPSETLRRPVPCPARPCRERCRSARTRTSGRCGRGRSGSRRGSTARRDGRRRRGRSGSTRAAGSATSVERTVSMTTAPMSSSLPST